MIQLLIQRLAVILQLRNEGNNYFGYSFSSMGTENPWREQFNSLITMVSAKRRGRAEYDGYSENDTLFLSSHHELTGFVIMGDMCGQT